MLKAHAYVLIGHDKIGKTTIQRRIWSRLCKPGKHRQLHPDTAYRLTKPTRCGPDHIFFSESSIQEKGKPAKYVDFYYHEVFKKKPGICVLSSHSDGRCDQQVSFLISLLRRDCYNTCGIFLSNSWDPEDQRIAELPWNETLWIENEVQHTNAQATIDAQLNSIGDKLADLIERRSTAPLG